MILSLRMELARISAAVKTTASPDHLAKIAEMESGLESRQRKIEELRAKIKRMTQGHPAQQ